MAVHVKCFASLREQVGLGSADLEHRPAMRVADVWAGITALQPPVNLLCARNHQYVDLEAQVEDGDEVAFFPPVTGG